MNAKPTHHRREHQKYLPDYNAQDRAVTIARRADPAADHAAQATVIYPLQRPGAPELEPATALGVGRLTDPAAVRMSKRHL